MARWSKKEKDVNVTEQSKVEESVPDIKSGKITIDGVVVDGKFTVIGSVDRSNKPPVLSVTGAIETPARLPDRIKKLEGGRAVVYDILIESESVGSEEDSIVYTFTAEKYDIVSGR